MITLNELIETVNRSEIASIRSTLTKIIEIIHNPDSSMVELKEAIEVDPPLTAKVLRLANSAYYGNRGKIGTILEAIIHVGFDTIKELALNQKVLELFKRERNINGYSRRSLWIHSVGVAICNKLIARREFCQIGDDMYTAGILHDIGIIVEDQFLTDALLKAIQMANEKKRSLLEAEVEILGYHHEDIGARLAESWEFPPTLSSVIGSAQRPLLAEEGYKRLAMVCYISNRACQKRHIGYIESPVFDDDLYQHCQQYLGIKEKAIEIITDEVEKEVRQMEATGWF